MSTSRLTVIASCLAATAMIASCSSRDSQDTTNTPPPTSEGVAVPPLTDPPPAPGSEQEGGSTLFPELQGTWARSCRLFDEEEGPAQGYERSEIIFRDDSIFIDTEVFFDSNCVVPLAQAALQFGDDFQSFGSLIAPGGSADTSVGAVPFLDIDITSFTIEDQPLVASIAFLFSPFTDFTIAYRQGDQLFFGNPDVPDQDGETALTRSVTLDFEDPWIRL